MTPTVALIGSPLTGPGLWSATARSLRQRGFHVEIPEYEDNGEPPYWQQHAGGVRQSLSHLPATEPIVLVGHSGAGPILPAIADRLPHPVAGYVFVDAGIPVDGQSRLDLMADEDPGFASWLGPHLAAGGRFPQWTDDGLASTLPDAAERRKVIASLRPRPEAYFTEAIPVPAGWPEAPCAYLRFSAAYDVPFARARALGWPTVDLDAGHFHMVVAPDEVASAIASLVACNGS